MPPERGDGPLTHREARAALAEVENQQSSVRGRMVADAVRTFAGETLAGTALATFHGLPHLICCREPKASGEHRGDPVALGLHDGEQPAWRVDESSKEETSL